MFSSIDSLSYNQLVSHYLIHSYLYYELDFNLITDLEYDYLCKRLDKHWDVITHPHKSLIDKESLTSTTGYYLKYKFPLIVQHIAKRLKQGDIKPLNP